MAGMMNNEDMINIVTKLQQARKELMDEQPFYSVLLYGMKFSLDEMCETACTDGKRIIFGTDFIRELNIEELKFILLHEVLHVVLSHTSKAPKNCDYMTYNIACDIVVNSNILYSYNMDLKKIILRKYGESMHIAPDGREGYLYNADEIYKLLTRKNNDEDSEPDGDESDNSNQGKGNSNIRQGFADDHTYWPSYDFSEESQEANKEFDKEMKQSLFNAISAVENSTSTCGKMPYMIEKFVLEMHKPQTDWKTILNDFLQPEVTDYSFNPPDRRFSDGAFILPDYNDTEFILEDIAFFVDTSGSMSDEQVNVVISEIKGALDQFAGKLKGWISFFSGSISEPVEIEGYKTLEEIKPSDRGGTSFQEIFEYLNETQDKGNPEFDPKIVVILTDGNDSFPNESVTRGRAVLWIINNDIVQPPWGKVARITQE